MERHFTATGFVVNDGKVLLQWHRKAQMWLPPGGHLLPDEDPVTGLLREVLEETGLAVEVLPGREPLAFAYPEQLPTPVAILLENSFDRGEPHKHVDFIFFCRPLDGVPAMSPDADAISVWVDEADLRGDCALELAGCGISVPVSEDVCLLALKAIEMARSTSHTENVVGPSTGSW